MASFGTRGALPGSDFIIQANFGKQVGGNLFQSFSQFVFMNPAGVMFGKNAQLDVSSSFAVSIANYLKLIEWR